MTESSISPADLVHRAVAPLLEAARDVRDGGDLESNRAFEEISATFADFDPLDGAQLAAAALAVAELRDVASEAVIRRDAPVSQIVFGLARRLVDHLGLDEEDVARGLERAGDRRADVARLLVALDGDDAWPVSGVRQIELRRRRRRAARVARKANR